MLYDDSTMKEERGMGIIAIIISIIVIVLIAVFAYNFYINTVDEQKLEDIRANMLLIQGKCKILQETTKVNNNQDSLKGRKLSEMQEDSIVSEFLNKGIVDSSKLDKYYALSNEDLSGMELDIQNEENSYYIVNYEDNTVFITKGYTMEDSEEVLYQLQ